MSGYACQYCYQPIRFIHEYQQWWCDRCQVYIPPATSAPAAQPAYQATPAQVYQQPVVYHAAPSAPAQASASPSRRDPISEALAKTKEGFDKMADYPRRERELRVKGFSNDEIQLILRHGYTEERVLEVRGKATAAPHASTSQAPQYVVISQPAAPAPTPQPQTTIIVQGDYVPSKTQSRVEIRDSVVNRANISGGQGEPTAPGSGTVVEGSVVSRSVGVGPTSPTSSTSSSSSSASCPNCRSAVQPQWKACPDCGLRLG